MSFNFAPQVYAQEFEAGPGGGAPAPVDEAVETGAINLGESFTLGTKEGKLVKDVFKTPADMVNLITNNLMILGGIFLFLMIIMAGFKFVQDDSKAKEEAKKIMKATISGFLLLFSAYWIVQIIQVITGANLGF